MKVIKDEGKAIKEKTDRDRKWIIKGTVSPDIDYPFCSRSRSGEEPVIVF
jgi:hypothetical protein